MREAVGPFEAVLPTLPHVEERGARARRAMAGRREHRRRRGAKFAAFRSARAALAASGTVTLELALAGVPMVGAYKVSRVEEPLKYLVKVPSILLPNLILGERAIPEFLQRECTPEALAAALAEMVRDGAAREAQIDALSRLDGLMRLPDGDAPSSHAARAVIETIETRVWASSADRRLDPDIRGRGDRWR